MVYLIKLLEILFNSDDDVKMMCGHFQLHCSVSNEWPSIAMQFDVRKKSAGKLSSFCARD